MAQYYIAFLLGKEGVEINYFIVDVNWLSLSLYIYTHTNAGYSTNEKQIMKED